MSSNNSRGNSAGEEAAPFSFIPPFSAPDRSEPMVSSDGSGSHSVVNVHGNARGHTGDSVAPPDRTPGAGVGHADVQRQAPGDKVKSKSAISTAEIEIPISKAQVSEMMDEKLQAFHNQIAAMLAAALPKPGPSVSNGPGQNFDHRDDDEVSLGGPEEGASDSIFGGSPSPKRSWKSSAGQDNPPFTLPPGVHRLASKPHLGAERTNSPTQGGATGTSRAMGNSTPDHVAHQRPMAKEPEAIIPHSWSDTMEMLSKLLDLPVEEKPIKGKASILQETFSGVGPQKETPIPVLPVDGLIDNRWQRINESLPSLPSCEESRLRRQYRWSETDYSRRGFTPNVDKAVSTYLATKVNSSGRFRPRPLLPTEAKAEKTLFDLDRIMRSQQRVVSHSSYLLVALRQALTVDSTSSEEDVASLLGGLASAVCDMSLLAASATAKCVHERRLMYADALNLPDKADREALLKVPIEGPALFGDKFNEIAKESSQLRRDAREMAQTLVSTANQPSQKLSGSGVNKRKFTPSAAGSASQFKKFKSLGPQGERRWDQQGPLPSAPSQNSIEKPHFQSQGQQPFRGKGSKWGRGRGRQ